MRITSSISRVLSRSKSGLPAFSEGPLFFEKENGEIISTFEKRLPMTIHKGSGLLLPRDDDFHGFFINSVVSIDDLFVA